jgi:SAM-dependent MidA family methyltransferase
METVLYAPGLGYYAAGAMKFGTAGDFVTAPELTPLFGRTLAHAIRAGAGRMWRRHARTRSRQRAAGGGRADGTGAARCPAGSRYCHPGSQRRVARSPAGKPRARTAATARAGAWLDALPEHFSGVVVGNEVLDALPVELVHWTDAGPMRCAAWLDGEAFAWQERPISDPELLALAESLALAPGYLSEIGLAAPALIRSLAERLDSGLILMIDYGFCRAEFFHPQRHMGTLRAHYRHHALDDPFYLPGLCDLTAHVDFSAIAAAGQFCGLTLAGYASQANFLLNAGVADLLMQTTPEDAAAYLPQANAVQRLVSPAEMGELFKAIAFTRACDVPLAGFARGDRRLTL